MAWKSLHDAPRDRYVWLFLPSARWKAKPDGTPYDVTHECVVAKWDARQGVWATEQGRHVYPSVWSDADIGGSAPAQPEEANT
jgi:hypothetical protein